MHLLTNLLGKLPLLGFALTPDTDVAVWREVLHRFTGLLTPFIISRSTVTG